MTGTQISEALHAVADATETPEIDRLAFQRLVRQERRRRLGSRAGLAAGVAAAVAVVATTTLLPFVQDGDVAPAPATPSAEPVPVDLQGPVFLVLDQGLAAIDPQGRLHDLGVRAEEVIGYTSERAYVVGGASGVVAYDIANSDEGPGGWRFERDGAVVDGPVQSAQLSSDGRWLGWVDLEERVHVRDLKAGTTADYAGRGSVHLVDVAQGTGLPLVSDDRGLRLLGTGSTAPFPSDSWDATATRDRIAVPYERSTLLYAVAPDGAVRAIGEAPGAGRLAPYGDLVASVSVDEGDTGSTAWLTVPGDDPRRLDVEGRPVQVAWADDDTVLVSSSVADGMAVYACDATDLAGACARLDVGTPGAVAFAR